MFWTLLHSRSAGALSMRLSCIKENEHVRQQFLNNYSYSYLLCPCHVWLTGTHIFKETVPPFSEENWHEYGGRCSSETLYPHITWHGVVTQRIMILTSTAMKNPPSCVLHIYINVFYITSEQGFSMLLCWCIIKWNLTISRHHIFFCIFVQIHWGLNEQSDTQTCDKQVPNCELISLAIKIWNMRTEMFSLLRWHIPNVLRLINVFKGVLSCTTQSP